MEIYTAYKVVFTAQIDFIKVSFRAKTSQFLTKELNFHSDF